MYWAEKTSGVNRVIQRSIDGTTYHTIGVGANDDFTLAETLGSPEAYYRSYAINELTSQVSAFSTAGKVSLRDRPLYYDFVVDGEVSEWEGVVPLATGWWSGETNSYRVFANASHLHVMFEGAAVDSHAIYFDTDNSPATGSAANPWAYSGFDILIRDNVVFDIRSGTPVEVATAAHAVSDNHLEISIPLAVIGDLGNNRTLLTAAKLEVSGESRSFPAVDEDPLIFVRGLPSPTPLSVTVANSETFPESQLIIQWQGCSGCSGYVVERASGSPDNFERVSVKGAFTFAHYDNELEAGTKYYYRVSSYNDIGLSVASESVLGIPGAVTALEPLVRRVSAFPNPVQHELTVDSPERNFQIFTSRGESIELPKREDDSRTFIDFSRLPAGLYLLRSTSSTEILRIVKR